MRQCTISCLTGLFVTTMEILTVISSVLELSFLRLLSLHCTKNEVFH